ncbi:MAG: carbohydrate ABC transporter permease [Lachnospiraceae bacterium]|jgi:multiple sugar transport system permease protein|nr:carbohydrate ABC transporter permease [Lachnospiraceae bacterium]
MYRENSAKRVSGKIGKIFPLAFMYLFLTLLLLICVLPFLLVLINSTHTSIDIVTRLNLTFGTALSENYEKMQSSVNIWQGFGNSLMISVPFTALTGYFSALTAYGFSKYRFKGNKVLFWVVLFSMMLPSQLSIIGFYQLNLKLSLLNSFLPFILPGMANATAVFFLKGMIEQSIPDSLIEAGRIEGSSEIHIFNRLILPCIMPGVATMCIFNFVSSWNNYLGPLVIMTDNAKFPMPVMIAMIKGLYQTNYGALYLAIAISVVPIIIVYIFLSRYIISGLTLGAEK